LSLEWNSECVTEGDSGEQMHLWMLVETTRVSEFECYFACTRKGYRAAA